MRLRPDEVTNNAIGYIVAMIARKYRVKIYALCVMSDHWHLVLHDPYAKIAKFTGECHSLIARVINHEFKDEESLWNSSQTNQPRLLTPADVLSRINYTMGNPVKHGLVPRGELWPGLRTCWPDPPRTFTRPKFFRDLGDEGYPPTATLELSRPLGFEHLSNRELADLIHEGIEATEECFRAARKGKPFLGADAVLAQDRWSRAKSVKSVAEKRRRRPTIICDDLELLELALEAEREWRATYRERLERWRAGDRDVVFPHGTYKMRVLHSVNVAPPPV